MKLLTPVFFISLFLMPILIYQNNSIIIKESDFSFSHQNIELINFNESIRNQKSFKYDQQFLIHITDFTYFIFQGQERV